MPRRGGGLTVDTGDGNSGDVVPMLSGSGTRVGGAGGVGPVLPPCETVTVKNYPKVCLAMQSDLQECSWATAVSPPR